MIYLEIKNSLFYIILIKTLELNSTKQPNRHTLTRTQTRNVMAYFFPVSN